LVQVRDYEPSLALDGGAGDGMRDLVEIVRGAADALRPGGFLALETGGADQPGADQPALVSALLHETGKFENIQVVADYAGIPRHVSAFRRDLPLAGLEISTDT